MSKPLKRTFLGYDCASYVIEEVDGVTYIGGCREDLHATEMMDVEGGHLSPLPCDPFDDGHPMYEFRDADPNVIASVSEKSLVGDRLEDVDNDDNDDYDDDDDDDDAGDAMGEPVLDAGRVNELLASEANVIVLDGGASDDSLLFRISDDSTILVDDPSGAAAPGRVDVPEPEVGMLFDMGEEFIAYLHRYAHSKGFGVRIAGSDRDPKLPKRAKRPRLQIVNNVLVSAYVDSFRIRVCCRKEGKYTSRSANVYHSGQTCRTGCMYKVTARRNPRKGGPWRISSVTDVIKVPHNHEFEQEYSNYLPRYRLISPVDQMKILGLQKAGVKSTSIYNTFVHDRGGYLKVPFSELDLSNFLHLNKAKPLRNGDFASMEDLFRKMSFERPGFFYDVEKDKHGRLKSVFWADSRCIQAFLEFGDIVSFDTTYLSNRYDFPFAVFVGTNHYGKTILFGCALIATEDTESFVWLFETWKKCMGGKAPLRILTDQAAPIGNAIKLVFPDATHRWCLWHVMQNCSKHLGKRKDWDGIYKHLGDILHDSFSVDEFEARWEEWVNDFEIGHVGWVGRMFEDRSKWCPVYFKSDFWAGMSSTQRSEGMHHYFKSYVNPNTGLSEFAEQYSAAICRRIAEEERDNLSGNDRHSVVTSNHAFEQIFEKLYSRPKFVELHDELIDMAGNVATKFSENETEVVYDVLSKSFRVGWAKKTTHRVVFTKGTENVSCECKNFEFRGILCAHALRVFWMEDTLTVPDKYVLDRWSKIIPRKYTTIIYPELALMGKPSLPAQRFHDMKSLCEDMSAMVMHDEELHKEVIGLINTIKENIHKKIGLPDGVATFERGTVGKVYSRVEPAGISVTSSLGLVVVSAESVKDPVDKRGRGNAAAKRKMSAAEVNGRRRACGRGKEAGTSAPTSAPAPSEFSPCTPVKMVLASGTAPKKAGKISKKTFQMNSGTGTFR